MAQAFSNSAQLPSWRAALIILRINNGVSVRPVYGNRRKSCSSQLQEVGSELLANVTRQCLALCSTVHIKSRIVGFDKLIDIRTLAQQFPGEMRVHLLLSLSLRGLDHFS